MTAASIATTPPRPQLARLYRWWAHDYPPLDGRLRFVVYGLLLWMWRGGSGWITGTIRRCPPDLFEPVGVLGLLGVSNETLMQTALALETPLIVVWTFAAVGLFGRMPLVLTGLGVAFVWGVCQGCMGSTHTWHAPMLLLLACGFLLRPDRWSLDRLISRRWPAWPFNPGHRAAPDVSGFACKLALLLVGYTLFAGGVAKLWQGGVAWLDGEPLHFYLANLHAPRGDVGRWMHATLLAYPPVVTALAVWTVGLELASILTLFSRRLRWPFFLNAWAFHLGIWLVMLPAYWPQMACYLLLVPWSQHKPDEAKDRASLALQRGVVGAATVACIVLVATMAFQREWFPLSHIPMYSSYVSPERIGDFPRADYGRIATLRRIAASAGNEDQPWWVQFELARRVRLVGRRAGNDTARDLGCVSSRIVDVLLWTERIGYALLDDVRSSPGEGGTVSNPYHHSQRVFDAVGTRILGNVEWSEYDAFELRFDQENAEPVVLAVIARG